MKCPNCRCILPNNMLVCDYCGYEFETGEARTWTVAETYRERNTNYDYLYSDNKVNSFGLSYNYYDYSNWLISFNDTDYKKSKRKKKKRRSYGTFLDTIIDNDFSYLLVIVVMLIIAIILSVVMLFV